MHRNLSINRYFIETGRAHVPRYRFNGSARSEWQTWSAELLPAVKRTLGKLPARVPLNPEVTAEWEEEGVIKQRFVIDVEAGLSAAGYLFRPAGASARLPAILASHGHGEHGKDSVMGCAGTEAQRARIAALNYDYGLQMARAGFVTIAIDYRGFGERDDRRKPHWNDLTSGRDQCNLHFLRASILGSTVLGQNISDAQAALDYLCSQSFVDPNRIGAMGLSFGGTMTTWMSLCDERIKAADIICYSDRFADFGMRDVNFCGSQITPGLFELCDVPDLHGLIAPRPLLVEIGAHDDCFLIDSAMSCFHEVEKIYAAAGARDKLDLDHFPGGHQWGGNKSIEFFRKNM